jgi:hypothetical protein
MGAWAGERQRPRTDVGTGVAAGVSPAVELGICPTAKKPLTFRETHLLLSLESGRRNAALYVRRDARRYAVLLIKNLT